MSLKLSAVSGVQWTGVSTGFTAVTRLVQLAILTRLLNYEDLGLMATVMVVIGFANAFVDMGLSQAIIYRQDATRTQLSSLYWLNWLAGLTIFGLTWLTTPAIAAFYQDPRLIPFIQVTSLVFLITPVGQQFQILLQKSLRFKTLSLVQIAARLVSFVVTVGGVWLGWAVWALVFGQLAFAIVNALLLLCVGWPMWRPQWLLNVADVRGFLSFGLYQMGERSVNYFAANLDYIIIGRVLGADALGLYSFAYELVVRPIKLINPTITRVAFPIFAQKQTDNRALQYGYVEVVKLLLFVLAPVLVGMAVTAPLFVPVLFSPDWQAAVPLIQILALVSLLKGMANPSGTILLAKGRADIGFAWNLAIAALYALVFTAAAPSGLVAVATTYALISIGLAALTWLLLRFLIQLPARRYIGVAVRPLVLSATMGVVVWLLSLWTAEQAWPALLSLIVLIACGGLIYAMLCLLFEKAYIRQLRQLLVRRQVAPQTT